MHSRLCIVHAIVEYAVRYHKYLGFREFAKYGE